MAVLIWATAPCAIAQKATEVFIPIGKSPGLSGVCTLIGIVDSVNTKEQIVFMHGPNDVNYRVIVTEKTIIYLDRSALKITNRTGTFADCRRGSLCEVLYTSHLRKREGEAEWIKVRVEKSGKR